MKPPAPSVFLQRITTTYSPEEDRLRLAGDIGEGAPLVIWLTQRLVRRLIPHLLESVDRPDDRQRRPEIIHSFAQQRARAVQIAEAPVETGSASLAWRASAIDIERSAEGVALIMRGPELPVALRLNALQLRQWLNILYDNYRLAGWPLSVWPDWVQEGARPQAAPQDALWH